MNKEHEFCALLLSESTMRSLLSSSKLLFTTTKGFLGTTKQIGQWGRSYSLMPGVIEHSCRGETAYDINGPIIDDTAGVVVGRLHFFECDNPSKPEPFYMYPPGGAVPAGLAINDTMEYIRFINKTCLGQAASMGSLIPVEDTNGERRSSKCNDHDSSQFGSRKARAISAQP